jgi:hypothetical protein
MSMDANNEDSGLNAAYTFGNLGERTLTYFVVTSKTNIVTV